MTVGSINGGDCGLDESHVFGQRNVLNSSNGCLMVNKEKIDTLMKYTSENNSIDKNGF